MCVYVFRFFRLVHTYDAIISTRTYAGVVFLLNRTGYMFVCLLTKDSTFSRACQLRCPHVRHKDASTRKRRTKKVPLSYACVSPVHMYFFSCAYACVVSVSQPFSVRAQGVFDCGVLLCCTCDEHKQKYRAGHCIYIKKK